MQRLDQLAKKFGFAPDSHLLTEAFTHRSYAVEHSLDYDNQRLEFLGDSVLEIVLTEALFRRYPAMSEGDMTKTRSALACEGTLALLARELGFEAVRKFLLELFGSRFPDPRQLLLELNPKGKLQEFSQQQWNEVPRYCIFHHSGPQHQPLYEVEVSLRNFTAAGTGRSRKQAEFNAAAALFQFLRKKGVIEDDL